MPEPTTIAAGTAVAAISGVTLALFGVDYYSLLYGMVGALLALGSSPATGRVRAVVFVFLSTLIGAAVGNVAVELLASHSRALLILGSVVGGAGAQKLVAAALNAVLGRISGAPGGTP